MGILMVGIVNPKIDRRISKKWKKTKLPGKTSWKVLIWHFVFSEWLFSGKIQFATLSKIQITIFYCFKQFLKELGCFFFTKAFKTFCIKFCLLDLNYFYLNNEYSRKKDFISTFNTFCFGQPCASFCQSATWRLTPKENKLIYN